MRFHPLNHHAKSLLLSWLVNASDICIEKNYLLQGFLLKERLSFLLGPMNLSSSLGSYLSFFSHLLRQNFLGRGRSTLVVSQFLIFCVCAGTNIFAMFYLARRVLSFLLSFRSPMVRLRLHRCPQLVNRVF